MGNITFPCILFQNWDIYASYDKMSQQYTTCRGGGGGVMYETSCWLRCAPGTWGGGGGGLCAWYWCEDHLHVWCCAYVYQYLVWIWLGVAKEDVCFFIEKHKFGSYCGWEVHASPRFSNQLLTIEKNLLAWKFHLLTWKFHLLTWEFHLLTREFHLLTSTFYLLSRKM